MSTKTSKSASIVEYKLLGAFNEVRGQLLAPDFADRLDKPLAYWALPSDRRLPLALMGRTIKEIIETPFEQLCGTPGIGQKKIASLVDLLGRALQDQPRTAFELPSHLVAGNAPAPSANGHHITETGHTTDIDPGLVSEAMWVEWRASVERHGLGKHVLGQYAPSLRHLARVIWNTPLDTYTRYTLAEIRAIKTHGEKRVRGVLEVFGSLHRVLAHIGPNYHLSLRIVPRFVDRIEHWIDRVLAAEAPPSAEEVRCEFVEPIVAQVRLDAGDQVAELVAGRLALHGDGRTVREAARELGLTRARVYQLLSEVADVVAIRWAEGQEKVARLRERLHAPASDPRRYEQFLNLVELMYPPRSGDRDRDDEVFMIPAARPRKSVAPATSATAQ